MSEPSGTTRPTRPTPPSDGAPSPADPVRWGFLATGKIARKVAADLALLDGARLVAVGSRSEAGAAALAEPYAARAHASYDALVADPDVEVVYVASPHALHVEHVLMALEAGKHVLCEKPMTLTRADTAALVEAARTHDRFLMEGMWTATHPRVLDVVRRVRAGEFGTPRHLHAELGFVVDVGDDDRMLDPALGAGALLDMGIYPLTLAHLLLGEAEQLVGTARLGDHPRGAVDLDVAVAGRYPAGALATFTASMTSWSSRAATLATDRGRLVVDDFHHPTSVTWTSYDAGGTNDAVGKAGPQPVAADVEVLGAGYAHELAEVGRCVRAGLRESPLVPHALSLALAGQMDDVLGQVGVTYPQVTGH
ncbi:MAG: oxidoreductase [Nocardioides sp.]|nr:oxidoreductase [Nocardioides sp.]